MRLKRTVESRYIPKGAVKVADKKSDAIAYLYTSERTGKPGAVVYLGRQAKAFAHVVFGSEASRAKHVAECFAGRQRACQYVADQRAERKAWVPDYKVGEIVNTCWGYDQTNREFYEIVGVKGKHVTLRQIAVDSYSTGWAQEKVTPLPGQYIGEPFERLAQQHGIKIGKHSFTYATRTSYTQVAGIKAYTPSHTSSYA